MRGACFILLFGLAVAGCASVAKVPLPAKTPYDQNPKARAAYLDGYRAGYRHFVSAHHVSWPDVFSNDPVAKARMFGFYDGQSYAEEQSRDARDIPARSMQLR